MGSSSGYQRGPQRRAWDTMAAAAATKKPVCKHRSLSTLPLPGACAARHCQGPMIQGQLPWENTQCIMLVQCHADVCRCRLAPYPYPSLPHAWVSQSPRISCFFNPVLSGWEQTLSGDLHTEAGPNPKLNPRSCGNKEREIPPSSLRSSGLNLHNQLDVPCICGIPECTTNHPILRRWTLWATIYIYFSFFVNVYVYASVCDFVCIAFLFPLVLGFCLSIFSFIVFSIVFSACYHWWISFLVWLLSSFFLFFLIM